MQSKSIKKFIQACRDKGLNVTYQRLAIFKTLTQSKGHPTVEDIYETVKAEHPTISLATVYKTLETLSLYNLVKKVSPLYDQKRYDSNVQSHDHLICIKCKKIVDFDNGHSTKPEIPPELKADFDILDYRLEVKGICRDCSKTLVDG